MSANVTDFVLCFYIVIPELLYQAVIDFFDCLFEPDAV